ncbi:Pimeloyl-ACP methyl ester carboxylesterase [Shimia gijangensis]|uniref:Pimeloyl-ACP methyl ester carboxylesterase n=1 Tax=Shimia gijangensis TaxID=1470563 RepID=A0A1M6CRD1_9RHOB|nr:alpha/beta hydrolase [Shimia gijangensis]SHI63567.1 Pimeloyl-ACP methyl ester carboxylesterase [Shimia gijangensis]
MKLFSRQYGQGARKAVALHCSLAHSGAWKQLASVLDRDLTITAVDLPGHGQSPDWDGQGDLTDAVVEAVLPFLGEPVDLIGHSYGGVVALRLAIEHPEKVRSLSLFEPVLMAVSSLDNPDEAAWNEGLMAEIDAELTKGDAEAAARLFMRVWGDGRRWADLPRELRKGSARRIGFIGSSRPAIDQDNRGLIPRLQAVSVPAVVMDGAQSPSLMKVVQDGIARRLGNARRVTFDGLAHMGPITHPHLVADEIRRTLAEATVAG